MIKHKKIKRDSSSDLNQIRNLLKFLDIKSHESLVKFSLYCAEDVFHLNCDETKELARNCINLVKQWLIDENSITKRQLLNTSGKLINCVIRKVDNDLSRIENMAADANAYCTYTCYASDNNYHIYHASDVVWLCSQLLKN